MEDVLSCRSAVGLVGALFTPPLIVKWRQLTDIQPCLNKIANRRLAAVFGAESRSVTHRDRKTLLRNNANNMLTRPPCDVPQASFADTNAVGFIARHLRLPEAGLSLLDLIHHGA